MNSAMYVIFFIIFTLQILQSTQYPSVDFNCKTRDGKSGYCVEATDCQPINNYIKQSNYVLTPWLRQILKNHTCEYIGQQIKVCCPKTYIVINSDNQHFQTSRIRHISNGIEHKNAKLLPNKCGINKNRNVATFEITVGKEATLNEFPWMAILFYSTDKGPASQCVGTIINERYILTAANCISKELISVRVGEHNTTAIHDCQRDDFNIIKCSPPAEDIAIEKAFRHERFTNSLTRNDIGLIRLSKPLNIYTENVRAICLPLQNSPTTIIDARQSSLILTGWGFTKRNFINEVLLKTEVSTITQDQCSQAYKKDSYDIMISKNQFCIGGQYKEKRNFCNADIGSPVQMLDGVHYTQYGIVSVTPKVCEKKAIHIINTRIDQYMDWILNSIEP